MQFSGLTILKFSAINDCLFVKYLELVPLFNSSKKIFFSLLPIQLKLIPFQLFCGKNLPFMFLWYPFLQIPLTAIRDQLFFPERIVHATYSVR